MNVKRISLAALLATLLAGATTQAADPAPGRSQTVPKEPGVYVEVAGALRRMPDWPVADDKQMVLPREPLVLIIVYGKAAVRGDGPRLGTVSGLTFTVGSSGSGMSFSHLIKPTRTEAISGRLDAIRVTFGELSPEEYLVVSEFPDPKDRKIPNYAGFLVKDP